jgi:hypothetical protein
VLGTAFIELRDADSLESFFYLHTSYLIHLRVFQFNAFGHARAPAHKPTGRNRPEPVDAEENRRTGLQWI